MTTVDLHHDTHLFGRPLTLAPGAVAGRHPCAVCRMLYARPVAAAHHLCPLCVERLSELPAYCAGQLAAVETRITTHTQAWTQRQDAIPDPQWERLTAMMDAWSTATHALNTARVERHPAGTPLSARAAGVASARARLAAVEAKIARTKARADDLLAWILEWEQFRSGLRALQDERARWTIAVQEVEAAQGAAAGDELDAAEEGA